MFRVDAAAHWHGDPFRYVVFDDVVDAAGLDEIKAILDEEPVTFYTSDIFAFDATAPEPTTAELRTLRDRFARELAPVMTKLGGKPVSRVDMRAYAYRPGHYLLPHTDHQDHLERVLAYAYYLPSPDPAVGGELELFRCTAEGGELVTTDSAKLIEPRPNRLVVFEVGDLSLHQVREVMSGLRLSLAGWFYA
jgi:Rps23 Pro-64 3,4-dihydroxylase Tpa1-like proline 4-hydroxylase